MVALAGGAVGSGAFPYSENVVEPELLVVVADSSDPSVVETKNCPARRFLDGHSHGISTVQESVSVDKGSKLHVHRSVRLNLYP